MRTIRQLIIHCTATPEGHELSVEALRAEHLRRGFHGIGYHFYIRRNGEVITTRPLSRVGAHAKGFNQYSIGIAYEGGLDGAGQPADTRTPEQRTALRNLVARLLKRFRGAYVCGHRDLSPDRNGNGTVEPEEWIKQCPCFDVQREL